MGAGGGVGAATPLLGLGWLGAPLPGGGFADGLRIGASGARRFGSSDSSALGAGGGGGCGAAGPANASGPSTTPNIIVAATPHRAPVFEALGIKLPMAFARPTQAPGRGRRIQT